jgi:pimeloyl-ACP methyl ester carboxylesterase
MAAGFLAVLAFAALLCTLQRIGAREPIVSAAGGADRVPYPPHGELIDVGGYRLHLDATGKGKPTVVLIAGGGDFSFDWSLVQPSVSRFVHVCSYDRAGFAWSDLGPIPRTMKQEAFELHLLLKNAGIKPPYVLVGHSLGGLIVRVYADQYPEEIAGAVLVDSTHEDTTLGYQGKLVHVREIAKGRPIPPVQSMKSSPPKPPTPEDLKQAEIDRKLFGPPKIRPPFDKLPADVQEVRLWFRTHPKLSAAADDYFPEELQAMYGARKKSACPFGQKPLIVMLPSGTTYASPPPGVSADVWKRVNEEKREQKIGLVKLSRNSKLIFAESSGHHIHLDDPQLVVEAIRQVVEAIRNGRKLAASPNEPEDDRSPRLAGLAQELEAGDRQALATFWKEMQGKLPLVEPIAGDNQHRRVTFLWRGSDKTARVSVLGGLPSANIAKPLTRLGDTDVWYLTETYSTQARFQYVFQINGPEMLPME